LEEREEGERTIDRFADARVVRVLLML